MVKELRQIFLVLVLMISLLGMGNAVSAAEEGGIFYLPAATSYGANTPAPPQGSFDVQFYTLVWGGILNLRYIIGAVAILMIVYAGFRMVTAQGDEGVYTKQRTTLLWAIIGLAIIGMAGEMARVFTVGCNPGDTSGANCIQGGFLVDPNAIIRTTKMFDQRTQIIITFIKYFIGSVAVLMIIRNGMRMITMGSTDDKLAQDKKNLIYSIFGLILIIMADNVINNVFYKIDLTKYPGVGGAQPAVDAERGVKEIVGITNAVVTIVAPLAVLSLIAGAIYYITAAGKDEQINKAKKIMTASVIGIIIIFGAFAIVSTFISGSFGNPEATAEQKQGQNAASSPVDSTTLK